MFLSLSPRSVCLYLSISLPEDQQQGVISELSTLRRQLRSEQRRLEGQLLQSDREETDTPISTR